MNQCIVFKAEILIDVIEGQTCKDLAEAIELLAEENYFPISELSALDNEITIIINADTIRNADGSIPN